MKSNLAVAKSKPKINPLDEEWVVVVDLETLGLKANTVILSCGIVVVDLRGTQEFDELVALGFQVYLDQEIQTKDYGRTTTPSTLTFWEKQKEENPEACYCLNPVDHEVLDPAYLMEAIKSHFDKIDLSSLQWYARNPTFDFGILDDLCIFCEIDTAWRFWNIRCVKTFCENTGDICNIKPDGYIHHNSLHDAAKDALLLRLNRDAQV